MPLSATPMSLALFGIKRRSISLFILLLNSYEPYSRAFNRDFRSKHLTESSIRQRSLSFKCLSLARNWQRKKKVFTCFNFSTAVTDES